MRRREQESTVTLWVCENAVVCGVSPSLAHPTILTLMYTPSTVSLTHLAALQVAGGVGAKKLCQLSQGGPGVLL